MSSMVSLGADLAARVALCDELGIDSGAIEPKRTPTDAMKPISKQKGRYTDQHAKSGLEAKLPQLETWPNQYKGYEITIEIPEYTAICPKTGLPDFGTIRLRYMPDKSCIELKSLKLYIHGYRNLGIFYENAVNRILRDVVAASHPVWAKVTGEFTARGGLRSVIEATYP